LIVWPKQTETVESCEWNALDTNMQTLINSQTNFWW
jgi:hypothetical protein